jgi:catechol 2,3-dioxygenase-like lactoylglutathione lyase family enzyme
MSLVTGTDFVVLPTRDLARAVTFYTETLGLPCSVNRPEAGFAEFETGNLTLNVLHSEQMGRKFVANDSPVALRVDDLEAARAELEQRGVAFDMQLDTGWCTFVRFHDPDGNTLLLHCRHAPR